MKWRWKDGSSRCLVYFNPWPADPKCWRGRRGPASWTIRRALNPQGFEALPCCFGEFYRCKVRPSPRGLEADKLTCQSGNGGPQCPVGAISACKPPPSLPPSLQLSIHPDNISWYLCPMGNIADIDDVNLLDTKRKFHLHQLSPNLLSTVSPKGTRWSMRTSAAHVARRLNSDGMTNKEFGAPRHFNGKSSSIFITI